MTLKVHHLKPAPGSHTKKTRVGRGEGSKGKTAGRGTKGTGARYQVPAGFEGVQLVPSIGLYHKKRVQFDQRGTVVPLADAPNPVMIASDPDLERADKTIAIGVPFEEQPES